MLLTKPKTVVAVGSMLARGLAVSNTNLNFSRDTLIEHKYLKPLRKADLWVASFSISLSSLNNCATFFPSKVAMSIWSPRFWTASRYAALQRSEETTAVSAFSWLLVVNLRSMVFWPFWYWDSSFPALLSFFWVSFASSTGWEVETGLVTRSAWSYWWDIMTIPTFFHHPSLVASAVIG